MLSVLEPFCVSSKCLGYSSQRGLDFGRQEPLTKDDRMNLWASTPDERKRNEALTSNEHARPWRLPRMLYMHLPMTCIKRTLPVGTLQTTKLQMNMLQARMRCDANARRGHARQQCFQRFFTSDSDYFYRQLLK